LVQVHEPERALADLNAALRLRRDPATYVNRGTAQSLLGNHDAAMRDFADALDRDPNYISAYRARSRALQRSGNVAGAIADLDAAARLAPADMAVVHTRCWVRASAGVDLEAALADCNRALEAQPDNPGWLDSRGLVHLRRGDLAAAFADYDMAVRLEPVDAHQLYGRGITHLRGGQTAEGEADLQAAMILEPDIADTYAGYGVLP